MTVAAYIIAGIAWIIAMSWLLRATKPVYFVDLCRYHNNNEAAGRWGIKYEPLPLEMKLPASPDIVSTVPSTISTTVTPTISTTKDIYDRQ